MFRLLIVKGKNLIIEGQERCFSTSKPLYVADMTREVVTKEDDVYN